MREIPGVQYAAVGLTLPYERALVSGVTISDGKEAGQSMTTNMVYVTPRYFDTLQIPVIAGRAFTDADSPDAQKVVSTRLPVAGQSRMPDRHLRRRLRCAPPIRRLVLTGPLRSAPK